MMKVGKACTEAINKYTGQEISIRTRDLNCSISRAFTMIFDRQVEMNRNIIKIKMTLEERSPSIPGFLS